MKIRIEAIGWDTLISEAKDASPAMSRIARADVRSVSLEVQREMKIEMPVDTGRARASWGSPEAEGIWEEQDNGYTIEQGTNVEYVQYLNEGHSKQAPAGFIDTIADFGGVRLYDVLEEDLEAFFK